jgi:hypothetical protein
MAYPIPPDARAAENFQVIRNFGSVDFEDHVVLNVAGTAVPTALMLGEPVVYTDATVVNAVPTVWQLGTTAGHIAGFNNTFRYAGWCWNKFASTFEGYGSPSCLNLGMVPIAAKTKHRVRVKMADYFYRPTAAANLRIKSTAGQPLVGDDVVVVDCGVGVAAKYACLLPGTGTETAATNPSTLRYKTTAASANPQVNAAADADEVANIRINQCIVGKIVVADAVFATGYCEIEFN